MIAGEMEVELVPQGTLIERIRAGGFGLGGILTADRRRHGGRGGQAEGRGGRQGLPGGARAARRLRAGQCLHGRLPRQPGLRADRAQLQPGDRDGRRHRDRRGRQHRAGGRDRAGPRRDAGPARRLPHRARRETMDAQTIIAKRIALELRDGMLVNLGIGIPTLVANYRAGRHARVLPVRERPDRHRRRARRRHGATACSPTPAAGRSPRCRAPAPSTAPCPSA